MSVERLVSSRPSRDLQLAGGWWLARTGFFAIWKSSRETETAGSPSGAGGFCFKPSNRALEAARTTVPATAAKPSAVIVPAADLRFAVLRLSESGLRLIVSVLRGHDAGKSAAADIVHVHENGLSLREAGLGGVQAIDGALATASVVLAALRGGHVGHGLVVSVLGGHDARESAAADLLDLTENRGRLLEAGLGGVQIVRRALAAEVGFRARN